MAVHVGDRGRALTLLRPQGYVLIDGQRLDARSEGESIDEGAEIVVLNGDHLGLIVRPFDPNRPPQLRDQGKRVYCSFGERVNEEGKQREAIDRVQRDRNTLRGRITGALLGVLAPGVALVEMWGWFREEPITATGFVIAGAIWGATVFHFLDALAPQEGNRGFHKAFQGTVSALLAAAAGMYFGLRWWGFYGGLAGALACTILGALLAPLLGIFFPDSNDGPGSSNSA